MGKLEQSAKKRARRVNFQKIILGSVSAVGLLSLATLAPNIIKTLSKSGLMDHFGNNKTIRINRARNHLLKSGLLTKNEDGMLRITEKGKNRLQHLELKEYKIDKPKKWDRKWRVLIFDVPEKRRGTRDKIRKTLHSMGFKQLQKSVWVYPYDCEDFVALLKADFKIGKDILYMIVEELEGDQRIKDIFGLRTYPLSKHKI